MTFVPVIPFNKYSIGDFARLFTLAACKIQNLRGTRRVSAPDERFANN